MKLIKSFNYIGSETNLKLVETDLEKLFLLTHGRVRFGSGNDGSRGENISGEFQVFTASATDSAINTITHTLSATPIGWIVISQDKGGVLYTNSNTATNSTITLVSTTTSTAYTIFLLK